MPSNIAMAEVCYSCQKKFCCSSSCPYDRLPALLSCQHVICYGCTQRIWVNLDIDDNNKLLCPVCNILTFLSPSTHHISFYFNKFCGNCAIKNRQIRNKLSEKRTEQTLAIIRHKPPNMALGRRSTPQGRNSNESRNNFQIVQAGIGDINISEKSPQNIKSNLTNQETKSKGKQFVTKNRNQSNSNKLHKKQKGTLKRTTQQKTSRSEHSQKKNEKNCQNTKNSTTDTTGKKLVSLHQTRTNCNTSTDEKKEKNQNQEIINSADKEILPSACEKSSVESCYEEEYGRAYSRLSSSSNTSGETDIKTNSIPSSELNKLDPKTDPVETRTSSSTQSLPNMSLSSCSKYDVEGKSNQTKSNATNATSCNLEYYRNQGVRRNGGSLSDDSSNVGQRKIRSSGRNRKPGSKMRFKGKSQEDDSDAECIPPLHKRGFLYQTECFKVLDCIYNDEKSELFRHEIKSKDVSDYYKVVKRGMCLDIIAYKIRNNIYTKVKEFSSDMYRIFDNCRLYNSFGSEAYQTANIVQNVFNQKMKECFSNQHVISDKL